MLRKNNYYLIGAKEIAEYFQIHQETARRHCQEGKLPAKKRFGTWRIKKSDLKDL